MILGGILKVGPLSKSAAAGRRAVHRFKAANGSSCDLIVDSRGPAVN